MTPAARLSAAIEVLDQIAEGMAAEQALTRWARASRYAGSRDRAAVRDLVFDGVRHWRSDAVRGGGTSGRARMIGRMRAVDAPLDALFDGSRHAPEPLTEAEVAAGTTPLEAAAGVDLPDWLFAHLTQRIGTEQALQLGAALQSRAPVTLRANLARTSRAAAQEALKAAGVETVENPRAQSALTVLEGARAIRGSAVFTEGLVELQDASSQAVVEGLPKAQTALDFCAGGGGKALALAALDWHVSAHDINPTRMRDLPARARRAGASVRLIQPGALDGSNDLVLCDAPCSGSGAWRRSPQGKWNLSPQRLEALRDAQAQILDTAIKYVASGGVLAYATCSVLPDENGDQIAAFLARHEGQGWRCDFQKQWPVDRDGDGFYVAHLTRGK